MLILNMFLAPIFLTTVVHLFCFFKVMFSTQIQTNAAKLMVLDNEQTHSNPSLSRQRNEIFDQVNDLILA